jgi:exosortase D (VPLPA-CTERM-specific)
MGRLSASAGWLKVGIYAGLILIIYHSTFSWLVTNDWVRDDYTHCALIPLAVLLLIWERRKLLATFPSSPSWKGLIPLGAGILLFWLGELGGEFFVIYSSFWLLVVGLCWLHLGWKKLKIIGFPILLISTMFPLPNFVNSKISLQLRLISSQLSVALLQLSSLPAYREGNVIDIGFTRLQVADACSGLRYVMPLMILSLIIAYYFKGHLWKRTVVFLSSIPLAVIVNSLRIAVTGILYASIGAVAAEGFLHGFSGWLIFAFSFLFLLFEVAVLRRLPPKEAHLTSKRSYLVAIASGGSEARLGVPVNLKASILQPVFVGAVIVLSATLVFSQGAELRQKIPPLKPFISFPVRIGEWTGYREFLDQTLTKTMNLNEYILVNYRNAQHRQVEFYVAYYDSQVKGESIHTPDTCLPGNGWIFEETGRKQIQLSEDGNSAIRVNRALMDLAGSKQIAYYWFPQRGRILNSLYELKLFAFWDALSKKRTDGALVRLVTPVYANERSEQSDERLQSFARLVVPMLNEYIPGK